MDVKFKKVRGLKAVSPLVATVILITICLSVNLLVYSTFFSTTNTLTTRGQVTVESVDLVVQTDGHTTFTITIKNSGSKPVSELTVNLAGTDYTVTLPSDGLQPGRFASHVETNPTPPAGGFVVGKRYNVVVKATFSDGSGFSKTEAVKCMGGGGSSASRYKLTVTVSPSDSGSVSLNPPSSDGYYDPETSVEVTAIPSEGYTFDHWILDGSTVPDNPITVTMNEPHSLEAYFAEFLPWLEGWSYCKVHELSSVADTTDHQVKIIVHYGSGNDLGEHVYLDGRCRADFGDLRFTLDDGVTEIPYWVESKTNGDKAIVWVKVPQITPNGTRILLYYDNPTATTKSDLASTMIPPAKPGSSYLAMGSGFMVGRSGKWAETIWDFGGGNKKSYLKWYAWTGKGSGHRVEAYISSNGRNWRRVYDWRSGSYKSSGLIVTSTTYRYIKIRVGIPGYCWGHVYAKVVAAYSHKISPAIYHGGWYEAPRSKTVTTNEVPT